MLFFWLGLSLSCALVCAREDVDKDELAQGQVQVRQPRGLVEGSRQVDRGDVEMSDQPAKVVEERPKPKKKKTPEEIEAGKQELLQTRSIVISRYRVSWTSSFR